MKKPKPLLFFLGILIPVFFVNFLVFTLAWTNPTQTPPQGNPPFPLAVGLTEQLKNAALGVGGIVEVFGIHLKPGSETQPVCNDSTRGMMWLEKGDTGVASELFFCRKNEDDAYAWEGVGRYVFSCGEDYIDPRDSQVYSTVEIGSQCWMAENLNYDDGCSSVTWVNSSDEGWCGCYGGNSANCDEYGLLYQWSAAMAGDVGEGSQGICPDGWHLPSDAEQHTLENYLATGSCDAGRSAWDCDPAGTRLKASSWDGDNSSGFSALPGGFRVTGGSFDYLGTRAYFWSSSPSSGNAWYRALLSSYSTVFRYAYDQANGFSVRCLRDN